MIHLAFVRNFLNYTSNKKAIPRIIKVIEKKYKLD